MGLKSSFNSEKDTVTAADMDRLLKKLDRSQF
jgi:hypothetical protein